jgi:sugar phosphate isomerase/epimerase
LNGIKSPDQQADLLKELGYSGICIRPANDSDALLAALDRNDLEVSASYVAIPAKPEQGLPDDVRKHIEKLKGRDTLIWFAITNRDASEEDAIRLTREICDAAKANQLDVALYPHTGFYTDTLRNCMDLHSLAERENLGLSLTLCHFLKQTPEKELEPTLKAAGKKLKVIQINGADSAAPGAASWDRLIQPLGSGDFEVSRVLKCLEEIGYDGPFALQCYNIKQPARDHLTASMIAWKELLAQEQPQN